MTRNERIKAARIALWTFVLWLIGWPMVLMLISIAVRAEQFCFKTDDANPGARSAWTNQSVVLWGSAPKTSQNGTVFIRLSGYGYNEAKTPWGSTDLVPLTGGAVKDIDGAWIVTLQGTLLQYSTIGVITGATMDSPLYYMVSMWWRLDPVNLAGYGHMGNVAAPFQAHIPGAVDDSYGTIVWQADCGSLR